MSTYLELLIRLQSECGVSGAPPTSVMGQPAEIQRLANFLAAAWTDVQELHADWNFLRSDFQFNTEAHKSAYTPIQIGIPTSGGQAVIGNWKKDSMRIYLTSDGVTNEMFMTYYDYDTFRDLYLFSSSRLIETRPVVFTIDPNKNLLLGPIPDGVYTVNGEYFRRPGDLTGDTDVPSMPSQFHLTLVYRAMMHYGAYEAASEVYQRGEAEFRKMKTRLEMDQLPELTFGAPLATM